MTCGTIHIIPLVSIIHTECVYAVLSPNVVRLFLSPVTEFLRTPIHPDKQSFCSNVIQTNPRLVAIVPLLNIHIFLLSFNSCQISPHVPADCTGVGPCLTSFTGEVTGTIVETPTWLTDIYTEKAMQLAITRRVFSFSLKLWRKRYSFGIG